MACEGTCFNNQLLYILYSKVHTIRITVTTMYYFVFSRKKLQEFMQRELEMQFIRVAKVANRESKMSTWNSTFEQSNPTASVEGN